MRTLTILALALLASACAVHVDLPEQFLKLSSDSRGLRATSSDEAVLWVRTFETGMEDSTLSFWAEALKNNLVEQRGYVLMDEADVTTTDGVAGKAFVLEATVGGETQRELLAVFFRGETVCTAEFVAQKDRFDKYRGDIEASLSSVRF